MSHAISEAEFTRIAYLVEVEHKSVREACGQNDSKRKRFTREQKRRQQQKLEVAAAPSPANEFDKYSGKSLPELIEIGEKVAIKVALSKAPFSAQWLKCLVEILKATSTVYQEKARAAFSPADYKDMLASMKED